MIIGEAKLNDLGNILILFGNYRKFHKKDSDKYGAEKILIDRIINNELEIVVSENEDGEITGFVLVYPGFSSTRMGA